ncbi:MAG: hypothetical protein Q4G25_15975 [Paracoccus sp. (in: a-proteobacteria)]|nr:hypothetical protein [Paracoccus sp. (in: a-proteobacteria)]
MRATTRHPFRAIRAVMGAAALGAALMAGLPAAAQGLFTPPAGCTLRLTVQARNCTVEQHFTCAADAPGDQRVIYIGQDGPRYYSRIDAETRWMESRDLVSGLSERLVSDAADHASFSTLLETGADDFDFWTETSEGELYRHVGRDVLTGETVTLDGVLLERTQFELKTYAGDGTLLIESEGRQFISREHGRFYGGTDRSRDWTGMSRESDVSPMRMIRPGEPGFAASAPVYGCDVQMVAL